MVQQGGINVEGKNDAAHDPAAMEGENAAPDPEAAEGQETTNPAMTEEEDAADLATTEGGDVAVPDDAAITAKTYTGGIEVRLLAYRTLLEIADEISAACKRSILSNSSASARLFVTTPKGIRAISKAQLLDQALRGLLESLNLAHKAISADETQELELGLAAIIAGAGKLLKEVTVLTRGLRKLLPLFSVTDSYVGHDITAEPDLMAAVVAARCLPHKLAPIVIAAGQTLPPAWSYSDLLPKLNQALAALRAEETVDHPSVIALVDRTERVLQALDSDGEVDLLTLMHYMTLYPEAPVLVVQPLASGGAYRERRHLFTALGLTPTLSVRAGAAVHYSLFDRKTGSLLAGDMLYNSSDNIWLDARNVYSTLKNIGSDSS